MGARFGYHHPAGEDVHPSPTQRRVTYRFIIQNERRCFPHELHARQLPARHMRAAIVDVGHLRAETANINWKVRSRIHSGFTAELIKHRQDLLRFAQREDWYEHACSALESAPESLRQPSLFTGPGPARQLRVVASRAFYDQHVDLLFWENRRLHDGLIVKINVSRVEDGFAFGAQQNSGRAEHVSCLEKLERKRVPFALWRPFAGNGNSLTQRTPAPAFRRSVRFPMREKRIRHFSDLLALPRHHVH